MFCAVVYLAVVYVSYTSGLLGLIHEMQGGAHKDRP